MIDLYEIPEGTFSFFYIQFLSFIHEKRNNNEKIRKSEKKYKQS